MRATKAEQHRHRDEQAAAAEHLHPHDLITEGEVVVAAEHQAEQLRGRPQHRDGESADVVVDLPFGVL